jgi:hypothetical protein
METAVLVVGTISLFVAIYFGVRALQKKAYRNRRGETAIHRQNSPS